MVQRVYPPCALRTFLSAGWGEGGKTCHLEHWKRKYLQRILSDEHRYPGGIFHRGICRRGSRNVILRDRGTFPGSSVCPFPSLHKSSDRQSPGRGKPAEKRAGCNSGPKGGEDRGCHSNQTGRKGSP